MSKFKDPDKAGTLHTRFERQVDMRPDAIAATCDGHHLSYAELNAQANQLAWFLRSQGVTPDTLVGIYMERSLGLLIAILGILKSSGAYLPIETAYPAERQKFMLEDACAPILLTQEHLVASVPPGAARVVSIDDPARPIWSERSDNLPQISSSDHLAYVIYTSGSTGKPKGVQISHRSVMRLFDSTNSWFRFSERDTWTIFHSTAFDVSVWEIFGALLYGGRAVVVPLTTTRTPSDLYRLLAEERVTVLAQTPSAFGQLSREDATASTRLPLALRLVILAGEALNMPSLKPWFNRHGDCRPQIINMYGPTETTVYVTFGPTSKDDLTRGSLIGIPLPDLQLHILGEDLQPAPVGVPGELFVGGACLARGYLNRPDLTAERFIADPSGRGTRLYRTGDRARCLVDGNYEYLGRLDRQIKVRGFRVELGEIEAALRQHPTIQSCTIVPGLDGIGQTRLWGYLVAHVGASPADADLRAFLSTHLPDYMIPAGFTRLERWPLTTHGKVDLDALPHPRHDRANFPQVRELSIIEARLLGFCRDILGHSNLGVDEPILTAGFHSLGFVHLSGRIQKELRASLSFSEMFSRRTIADMAVLVEERNASDHATYEPLEGATGPAICRFHSPRSAFGSSINSTLATLPTILNPFFDFSEDWKLEHWSSRLIIWWNGTKSFARSSPRPPAGPIRKLLLTRHSRLTWKRPIPFTPSNGSPTSFESHSTSNARLRFAGSCSG